MPRDISKGIRTDPVLPAARDVVCGRTLDPNHAAARHEHGGETYYFHSEECLRRFLDAPDEFASETAGSTDESRMPWPGWPNRGE